MTTPYEPSHEPSTTPVVATLRPPPLRPPPPGAPPAGPPSPWGEWRRHAKRVWPYVVAVIFAALTWGQGRDLLRLRADRTVLRERLAADSIPLVAALSAAGAVSDSLTAILDARAASDSASNRPYIVISIADNRLWYKQGDEVLFETRVATGSGKFLEKGGAAGERWKFETPRGRLTVQRKDVEPAWVPPDWHFIEAAAKKKLKVVHLRPGMTILAEGGAVVTISGANVVTRHPDGREVPFEVKDGAEIRVGDQLIVPPFGTNQRRYLGVLGANRLYLGDGYGIHGTDNPSSIGRSVSHGCIRVRNEDIETLFRVVDVGTPVYVY